MEYTDKLLPCVYRIKKVKLNNDTQLAFEYIKDRFVLPPKIYGDYNEIAQDIFGYYLFSGESVGCLFHGEAGAGKSLLSEILCNIGIQHQMPVVYIHGLSSIGEKIVELLATLKNMVVYFDEFGKMFSRHEQERLLSIFDKKSEKNVWILTENHENLISNFISNRPGRIRYNMEFNKISESGLLEYCRDYQVSEGFINDLLTRYRSADVFTFDHLQTIVSEEIYNLRTKGESIDIDTMCLKLNVRSILSKYYFRIKSIHYRGNVLKDSSGSFRIPKFHIYEHMSQMEFNPRTLRSLFSNPNMIKLNIYAKVPDEIYQESNHQDNQKNMENPPGLQEAEKFHIETLKDFMFQVEVDEEIGSDARRITATYEHFKVYFGLYGKNDEEVFI